ncbi:MAG: hypothetical protein ACR2KU_12965 [Gammaproteobacteria bacterium]
MALGLMTNPALAASFTVNLTGDQADSAVADGICDTDGNPGTGLQCTLRAAIQQTNATSSADTINFAIPGVGIKTILPTSALEITQPVTINGYTQPGARPNTKKVGDDAIVLMQLAETFAGNNGDGLSISDTGSNSVIRGLVINRFSNSGIRIKGNNNKVEGNFLGTDPTGTVDLGNGDFGGVLVNNGDANTIGGNSPADRNLISGNQVGVSLNVGSVGNKVQGNYIGTDKNGTAALGNDRDGVEIVDASRSTIGGSVAEANIIAFNGLGGVVIKSFFADGDASGNRIQFNSIFANGTLGIDLGNDGQNSNDPKDPDAGENDLQNAPVITSVAFSGEGLTIKGKLNSTPRKAFLVEFFANPTGESEGKKFIGNKAVSTNANGNVSFTFVPSKAVFADSVTATATNVVAANTSEFSLPRQMSTD